MSHSHKIAASNSQKAKVRRLCGGYASGGTVSDSSIPQGLKKGGGVKRDKKIEGTKAAPRSDKKKRGFDDGGAINTIGEENKKEMNSSALNPANKVAVPPINKPNDPTKLARGGRAKDKLGTKINITVGMPGNQPPQMVPVPRPVPVPMPPPGAGPGLSPMGPGGPPMPPPGMGPGGPPIMPRTRGGRTMPNLKAGSGSGIGRQEKMGKNPPLKRK